MTPDGWTRKTIGDCLQNSSAGAWGAEASGSNEVQILRSTNLTKNGGISYQKVVTRSLPTKHYVEKRLNTGDILLERSGGGPNQPVGRVGFFEAEGLYSFSNFMQKLTPAKNTDSKFLFYLLWFFHKTGVTEKLQQATTGIRNLNYHEYLKWPFFAPPISEQRRIAEIFTSADDAIQATQKVIEQTQQLKQGLMQELLTRGIGHTKFKMTEFGEIPECWELTPLTNLVEINPKRSVSVGKILKFVEMAAVSETFPFVSYLRERTFNGSGSKFQNNDILFARITPCAENGKTSFVDYLNEGEYGGGSTELIVLSPIVNKCVPKYAYFLAKWEHVRGFAIANMEGTSGRQRIPARVFSEILVGKPPLEEQKRIAEILTSVDDEILALQKSRDQQERVKQGLMQDLLSGKVRVVVQEKPVKKSVQNEVCA